MNIILTYDSFFNCENKYFNFLSLVYYKLFNQKRSEYIVSKKYIKKKIVFLDLKYNKFTLNLKDYINLIILNSGRCLTEGSELRYNKKLKILKCMNTSLKKLDLKYNTNLKEIYCINTFNLEILDISLNKELRVLRCPYSYLQELDLSNCTKLEFLICDHNKLKYLNLNKCKQLKCLFCPANKIQYLDLSHCKQLKELNCHHNYLKNLNLKYNTQLKSLSCDFHLENLNITCHENLLYFNL